MPRLSRTAYVKFTERLLIVASVVLSAWMVYLVFDLPVSYRAQNWDVAWIGFDLGMLFSLSTTAWALWHRRQLAIPAAITSATLLIVDAWFDVVTSQVGFDLNMSLVSAFLVELPLAFFLIQFSRRVIRESITNAQRAAGVEIISVSLIRTPITLLGGPEQRGRGRFSDDAAE